MGHTWSVTSSDNKLLSNGETCEEGIKNNQQYLKILIKNFKGYKLDLKKDYKKYGLVPCQQIRRKAINGILVNHYGLYLFGGIMCEMGTGPTKCQRDIKMFGSTTIIGLNTLEEFDTVNKYTKKKHPVYKVETKMDSEYATLINQNVVTKEKYDLILVQLNKILEKLGNWDFNVITNNCQHFTNDVSFGLNDATTKLIKFGIRHPFKYEKYS